jgi:hypothetical protein
MGRTGFWGVVVVVVVVAWDGMGWDGKWDGDRTQQNKQSVASRQFITGLW